MIKKVPKPKVKEVIIDVLKPNGLSIIELGKSICKYKKVKTVNIEIYSVDKKTENGKITITGKNLDFLKIEKNIEKQGCAVHSLDGVLIENKWNSYL